MELVRLCKENIASIELKNIYFAGFSPSNIRYFQECYPEYIEDVCGVYAIMEIDDRTPVSVSVGEKIFTPKNVCEAAMLDAGKDIIIIMYEFEKEAYEKLRSICENNGVKIYWFADKASETELVYRDWYSSYPIEDIILFRSGPKGYVYGEDFADNSRALFEYMVNCDYNRKWKLVWLVNEPDHEDYALWKQKENIAFIGLADGTSVEEEKRDRYYRYLCLARYAFITDDETFFRRRRGDQTLVQLWHGDGVKGRTRFRRMEKRFEYMVCTSRFFADVNWKDFGLREDQMLACGYPKDDWVVRKEDNNLPYLIKKREHKHYILWGPTYRKTAKGLEMLSEKEELNETALPLLVTWGQCESLNSLLKDLDCMLVIKLHPIVDLSLYENRTFSNIRLMTNQELFERGLHINQIMQEFDAFITDYSSAAYAFLLLDRPMAFTLDDLNKYDFGRGFVLNPVTDFLPGEELYSIQDMMDFIMNVCAGEDTSPEKRRALCDKMLDFKDGKSSERLLKALNIK